MTELHDPSEFIGGMKPPFSYYGGKQRMASKIIKLLVPHTVYVEPCCGSGTIKFAKGLPNICNSDYYREVLNDVNGLITNFFRVCQDAEQFNELLHKIRFTPHSYDEYQLAKRILGNQNSPPLDIAWAFYVNVQQSFSNKQNGGWATSVLGRNHASVTYNKANEIESFRNSLSHAYIDNRDMLECIKKWDSPQTLFYIDPPYPGTSQGHYSGYTQEDFQNLISLLKTVQGSFLLSCYDNDAVPSDWERFEFSAVASSKGIVRTDRAAEATERNAARTEVVWRKVSTVLAREKLRPIMQKNLDDILASQEDSEGENA